MTTASADTSTVEIAVIDDFHGQYRFLSNFWQHPDGATVEHLYQSIKTTDPEQRATILAAASPGEAKRLGQQVALRPGWEQIKVPVMAWAVAAKFADPGLRAQLLSTGQALLIEGNTWHDNEWGDCRCGRAACSAPGRNMLGAILMATRATYARIHSGLDEAGSV